MISRLTLLSSLFIILPAQAQMPAAAPTKAAVAATAPLAPASAGYSREKATEVCTSLPRSEWLPEEEMKLLAQHRGYRIKTFKVANNSCYEIYGFDRDNRIVEAYFNPVTARLVRQNMAR
jgi:hypothetical protein